MHLISSPRGEGSISIKLGNAITEQLQSKYPGSTVTVRNLATAPFPHLEEVHLNSLFTPEEARSEEQVKALQHSDQAIAELTAADAIVIGVPMYNFSIHSSLKTWLDHVIRSGVTFRYSEQGAEGLVKNKKVFLAIATGGVYSEEPMKAADFTEPYLRSVLNFIGITDITVLRAEGLAVPDLREHALQKAVAAIAV